MRKLLWVVGMMALAAGWASPARAYTEEGPPASVRRQKTLSKHKKHKKRKKRGRHGKKKRRRQERAYSRRWSPSSSRSRSAPGGHRVVGTGRVLTRPEAERLARPKVSPRAGQRLAKAFHGARPGSPGVDARGVRRLTAAQRKAAQRLPSSQWPKGMRRTTAPPPDPQLASFPGGGLFDGLAKLLSGRWGSKAAPTISALQAKAREHHLNGALLAAITDKESTGRYWISSSADARGAMQVKPGTAADVGVHGDLLNPMVGIEAGARYFKRLLARFGDTRTALAHYYSGEYSKHPNWKYADDVLGRYRSFRGA